MGPLPLCLLFGLLSLVSGRAESPVPKLPVNAGWAFANRGEAPASDEERIKLISIEGYDGLMGCKFDSLELILREVTVPGGTSGQSRMWRVSTR
jgi:hypothetical protein